VRRAWTGDVRGWSASTRGSRLLQDCDIFVSFQIHRNVERRLEMGEDKLAAVAAYDMLFPEIAFFERERTIVIGCENFGIGTKFYRPF
jgi:hypothetical protein